MILRELCFLNSRELSAIERELEEFRSRPRALQLKRKADTLTGHGKYSRALSCYREALACKDRGNTGAQFRGTVHYNMGCVYGRMFRMEEACSCFLKAYEDLHTFAVLKSYLFSVFMKDGETEYRKKLEEFGVDEKTRVKLTEEIAGVQIPEVPEDLDQALEEWTKEYHRQTDL